MLKYPLIMGMVIGIAWGQDETADKRLQRSANVLQEIMSAPDKGIPRDLLNRARCMAIIPGFKKAAFGVGADYGRGFAVCRLGDKWTGPAAIRTVGGSFGAQLGVESTDIVMLVMNQRGMDHILADKFTIGADVSGAIGPIGRTIAADTDLTLRAELLTWARAKGIFAGASLDGTTVTADRSEDRKMYGSNVSNREILRGQVTAPAGDPLLAFLGGYPGSSASSSQALAQVQTPAETQPAQQPAVAQTQPVTPSPEPAQTEPAPAPEVSQTQPVTPPADTQAAPQSSVSQAEVPAPTLPQTASPYPAVGAFGILLLGGWFGLRFATRES